MKIYLQNNINFQRRLKPSEEAEYSDVLNQTLTKGKKVLIVPATSLPNQTGVGNLGTKESLEFFDFAQKYWGINEIQILPMGQYHNHNGEFPFYSGTSMNLGEHVINIKDYVSENEYKEIVQNNKIKTRVNLDNLFAQDKTLWRIFEEGKYKPEFEKFKQENISRLEPKALYRVLREINGTHDYQKWNETDRKLFELTPQERNKRIEEIKKLKGKEMDFYYFKQFLAEDSLNKARKELNKRNLKLNGDMLCGFSYDEVWAHPNAFHKNTTIGWGLPALNFDSAEGEKLLREKVNFFAKRYDGLRVDAAWSYVSQPLIKDGVENRKEYSDRILNIIDDEVKNVKGMDYDLRNIMHENLGSFKNRVNIITSDNLSQSWGSNKALLEQGWSPENFILGAKNHDSAQTKVNQEQIKILSKIYNIPPQKLADEKEFMKAKLAEPMNAHNNMLYFMDALNIKGQFQNNPEKSENYAKLITPDYQQRYFNSLENGEGFNPMDALEKNFKAKGLDKKEPELYKKIVKFRKILEQKEKQSNPAIKWLCGIACFGLMSYSAIKYRQNHKPESI